MYFLVRLIVVVQDPDLQMMRENLQIIEATRLEIEHINGVYYLWMVFPNEGHKFIAQSENKEELAQKGQEYLLRKFHVFQDS